jgi:hypothetical protein
MKGEVEVWPWMMSGKRPGMGEGKKVSRSSS